MQHKPATLEQSAAFLTMLVTSEVMLSSLEQLQGTNWYRHETKKRVNALVQDLQKFQNQAIPLVWGTDDTALYALMDYQKEIAHSLATVRPEVCGILLEVLKKYKEDPEGFLQLNEIVIS